MAKKKCNINPYHFKPLSLDGLVKSRFWDGKEKSSRSRRANPEECSVLTRTWNSEGCSATKILDFLRSRQKDLQLNRISS